MTPNLQTADAASLAELSKQLLALADVKEAEENARKWRNIARPNQLPPPGKWVHWLLCAGRGCVAAGTRIYEAERNKHVPVEELWAIGEPITVMSLTPEGPKKTWATAPFLKGSADLWRVTLENGRLIVVTDQHRFLTQQGWRHAQHVSPDDLLACDVSRLPSTLAPSPEAWRVSDRRSLRTVLDFRLRYLPDYRSCGEPLLPATSTFPVVSPSPDDAPERSGQRHVDDPARKSTHSHHHQILGHLSIGDSCLRGTPLKGAQFPTRPYDHEHIPPSSPEYPQWPLLKDPASVTSATSFRQLETLDGPARGHRNLQDELSRRVLSTSAQLSDTKLLKTARSSKPTCLLDRETEAFPDQAESWLPYVDSISWQRVRTIEYCGLGPFFDLTVPSTENYLAEGMWHHNSGKTRTAAEFHKEEVIAGRATRAAIIAPTAADLRDVIVEGESGILAVWNSDPAVEKPEYQKTNRCIKFPNGSIAFLYSCEEPERLRGPQHDFYLFEELAAGSRFQETWDMLQFGLRLGKYPRGIITTTPKPLALLKELRNSPYTVFTGGSTYDNRANLPPVFFDLIVKKYEGTRLGQQELEGIILDETPDALWREQTLKDCYVDQAPRMRRIVVIIDPSTSSAEDADEAGLIVAGEGEDGEGYLLRDGSKRGRPDEWAREAVNLYHEFEADGIIAEKNQGGEMIGSVLQAVEANVPFRLIHASKSKEVRAEPVAALYEQKRIHHVRRVNGRDNDFRALEAQMLQMSVSLGYTGRGSPDRCDAVVHGFNDLLILHAHGAIHFLPEFRAPKPDSTETAPYITNVLPAVIPYWAHRWVSVSLGPISAAHWYAQDGDQARIYREMIWDSQPAERIGSDIANASETELAGAKVIQVWLDKSHFDAKLGNKSVAQSLSDGIARILGAGAGFLGAYNEFEQHIANPEHRLLEFKRREASMKERRMTVTPIEGDPLAGWEHLRSLLHHETKPSLIWNAEYAAHLRDTDQAKYDLYLNAVAKATGLEPPKLLIHAQCPETIRSLGSLSRDERNNDQPQLVGETGAVASSVNIGMLAHRAIQQREPLEEFLARRLDSVRKRYEAEGKTLGADILFQVEQKARADYGAQQPQSIDLRVLPSRRMA